MSRNIHCTYISEKVNKIRWRPNPFNDSYSFITASWDNYINNIRLWEIKQKSVDEESDINPYEIKDLPFNGDITELKFINADNLIASSSQGSVYSLKITTNETGAVDISEEIKWENIHKFKTGDNSSCTSFANHDNDIASVGEDGRINLFRIHRNDITRSIDEADSGTINCVEFLKFNELLTSNIRGQMKIWDLRNNSNTAASMFMINADNIVAATSIAYHPTQRHIIAAGDEQGSLTLWDLRRNTYPINVITSHTDSVAEVKFHPDIADQIFSCSDAGDVFHWSAIKQASTSLEPEPWFMSSAPENKYEIFRLMPQLHIPVNSLDLNRDRLLCGGDNEAMYLIEGLNIYS